MDKIVSVGVLGICRNIMSTTFCFCKKKKKITIIGIIINNNNVT